MDVAGDGTGMDEEAVSVEDSAIADDCAVVAIDGIVLITALVGVPTVAGAAVFVDGSAVAGMFTGDATAREVATVVDAEGAGGPIAGDPIPEIAAPSADGTCPVASRPVAEASAPWSLGGSNDVAATAG